MKPYLRVFVLAIVLLIIAIPSVQADSKDWSLKDIKGEKFILSENLGESPVLLVFWATWCAPCKKEMDEFRDLFDSYLERGVKVIAISEDNQKSQAKVKPYIESKGYKWQVLFDPDGQILKRYGGTSIPYTVLLDKEGTAQLKNQGAIKTRKTLTDKIDTLMGTHGE